MKNLRLNLKAKWYDMIESGEKTEEYREIKPILLTEDVLKVNEFECVNGDWCYNAFYFSRKKDGTYYINIAGIKSPLYYVYELQHALRLCGLTELADNFKLKAMEE